MVLWYSSMFLWFFFDFGWYIIQLNNIGVHFFIRIMTFGKFQYSFYGASFFVCFSVVDTWHICCFNNFIQKQPTEVLFKKVFWKISQNSLESTCGRVFFLLKLQAWGLQLYEKRDTGTRCFPVNFFIFLRIYIFIEHLWMTASVSLSPSGILF